MTKVLIVDDEPFVIRMLRDKLQNAGISVVSAVNGKEAVGLAMTERPNLIIMDWMMPEMNGIDACKTIRTNPEHAGTPIIMLTARTDQTESRALEMGAHDYLTKPVRLTALSARVKAALRRVRA